MGADALAAALGLAHGDGDLLVGHRRFLRRGVGHLLARQVELDEVDAVLEEHAHGLAHLLGPADDPPKRHLAHIGMRQRGVAEAAHGDLLAGGEVARAGDQPAVDGVADHHVEPRLGAAAPTQVVQPMSR